MKNISKKDEMMKKKSALIFGKNEYSVEIAKNISHKYEHSTIFTLKKSLSSDIKHEGPLEYFDLSDNWHDLDNEYDMQESIAFCALEDDAENIFLCISLRAAFSDLIIIALATNKESSNKLFMAGANKVIPIVQTTADIIVEMLEKPVTTEVLHNILYEKSSLKIAQIEVQDHNYFEGKYPADIAWSREHGIIVLSVMHEDLKSEFIYSSQAKHHPIKQGDIFVVVGYEEDINSFEKLIGRRCDVDWRNWSR
jgi:Trk K+ transport system NAD-binding subunit